MNRGPDPKHLVFFFQLKATQMPRCSVALPFAGELSASLQTVGFMSKPATLGPDLVCVGCRFQNQSVRIWIEPGPLEQGVAPCFIWVYQQIWGTISESEPRAGKISTINYAVESFLCRNDRVSGLNVITFEEAEEYLRRAFLKAGLPNRKKMEMFYP